MTDDERQHRAQRIFAESHAILARPVEDIGKAPEEREPERHDDEGDRQTPAQLIAAASRDPVGTDWRMRGRNPKPEPQREPRLDIARAPDWSEIDARIEARIAIERDAIGEVIRDAVQQAVDELMLKDAQLEARLAHRIADLAGLVARGPAAASDASDPLSSPRRTVDYSGRA